MQNTLFDSNPIPLAAYKFLDTKTYAEAEKALENTVEPRRFSSHRRNGNQGIQVTRYQLGEIQLFGLHFEGALSIASERLESVNIIIPISGRLHTDTGSNTTSMSAGLARINSPGEKISVEWESSSTSLVARIPRDTLNRYCRELYDIEAYQDIRFAPVLDLSRNAGSSFHNILDTILREADNTDSLLNRGVLAKHFQEILVTALLNLQTHSLSETLDRQSRQVRPFYIRKAIAYIHDNAADSITPADLVKVVGVSLRSLQAGFASYHNIGPSAYIKQVKMQKAREQLLIANHLETTVAEVAASWGFYNPCSFTGNYRKLYGENPSETLRR